MKLQETYKLLTEAQEAVDAVRVELEKQLKPKLDIGAAWYIGYQPSDGWVVITDTQKNAPVTTLFKYLEDHQIITKEEFNWLCV